MFLQQSDLPGGKGQGQRDGGNNTTTKKERGEEREMTQKLEKELQNYLKKDAVVQKLKGDITILHKIITELETVEIRNKIKKSWGGRQN